MNRPEVESLLSGLKEQVLNAQKDATSAESRKLFESMFVIIVLLDELIGQVQSMGGFNGVGTGQGDQIRLPGTQPQVKTGEPVIPSTTTG